MWLIDSKQGILTGCRIASTEIIEDSFQSIGWKDYGREMLDCCGYNIPEHLLDFFDLESYGRYCGDYNAYECENGLIEIY